MLNDSDIERLKEVGNKYHAADALGLVLYGGKNDRFQEFRRAFLVGVEDSESSNWLEARGIGPASIGNNLAAVWSEKR